MAKIEMPREPEVERVWTKDPDTGEVVELVNLRPGWQNRQECPDTWLNVLVRFKTIYTTHPDLAVLERYPAPFSVSTAGTVRDATGKAVMDPTHRCPPCLTRFFMKAANFYAEHYHPGATDEGKR